MTLSEGRAPAAVKKGNWVTRNLGLKLGALTLSVLLYSWVHGSEDVRRSVDVDILVIPPSDASGRILTSEVPPRVRLTLHGSRSAINSLVSASLPPVELDLRTGDLDVYYFSEEQFDLPAGVALSQMAPASIPLSWEQRVERQVPVEVDGVGELRSGLVLTGPAVPVPSSLGVVGPESAVAGLSVLLTSPVDLTTLREGTVERRLDVVGLPELTRFTSESQVSVTYRVGAQPRDAHLPRARSGSAQRGTSGARGRPRCGWRSAACARSSATSTRCSWCPWWTSPGCPWDRGRSRCGCRCVGSPPAWRWSACTPPRS
jgi:hypothetical protein